VEVASSTVPGATAAVASQGTTPARQTLIVSPAASKLAPGNGSKARMRRSTTAAGRRQSTAASARSIFAA